MQSFTIAAGVLSAISSIPAVSAHGYVANVVTGGQTYDGASPNWIYGDKPDQAGWYAYNQDNGYVPPSQYKSVNISCHKGATPGTTYIPVTAGDTVDFMWNTWPDSHKGPILTYMASCNGDCTAKQNASSLDWFKVEAKGLLDPSANEWATDKLISNNFTWTSTVPADIAPGNFVLRHEIIALHSASTEGGAQNYPMCFNIKLSGSGSKHPCEAGADCRKGKGLYSKIGAGIKINIYTTLSSYTIPGPKVWSSLSSKVKRVAQAFVA